MQLNSFYAYVCRGSQKGKMVTAAVQAKPSSNTGASTKGKGFSCTVAIAILVSFF